MKRLMLAVIMVALAIFFILPACGGGGGSGGGSTSVVGGWNITNIDGVPIPPNTAVFVFNANGTGALTGLGQTENFVWTQEGNFLTITSGGDTETVTLNWLTGNKVQVVYDGDSLIMVRL